MRMRLITRTLAAVALLGCLGGCFYEPAPAYSAYPGYSPYPGYPPAAYPAPTYAPAPFYGSLNLRFGDSWGGRHGRWR
jgi:hypothetical protein